MNIEQVITYCAFDNQHAEALKRIVAAEDNDDTNEDLIQGLYAMIQNLRAEIARLDTAQAERDALSRVKDEETLALRTEIARQADVITELEHKRASLTAEVDRLDALKRQLQQDNEDAAAPL